MEFKKPILKFACQKPVYKDVATLYHLVANHPELVNPANYSPDELEVVPRSSLDAIDLLSDSALAAMSESSDEERTNDDKERSDAKERVSDEEDTAFARGAESPLN